MIVKTPCVQHVEENNLNLIKSACKVIFMKYKPHPNGCGD